MGFYMTRLSTDFSPRTQGTKFRDVLPSQDRRTLSSVEKQSYPVVLSYAAIYEGQDQVMLLSYRWADIVSLVKVAS